MGPPPLAGFAQENESKLKVFLFLGLPLLPSFAIKACMGSMCTEVHTDMHKITKAREL